MADTYEVIAEVIDVVFPDPVVIDMVMVEGPPGPPGEPGPPGDPGGPGTTSWDGLTDKPAVIAAGATQSDARASIGAGTSNLALGSSSSTAKRGDYTPIYAEVTAALGFTPESAGNRNAANGYAGLDSSGLIPASLLPGYVDDTVEAATFAALPVSGESGKLYVTLDANKVYRWSGSVYVEVSASPGSTDAVPEGSVNQYFTAGRAQSALASQLAGKSDVGHGHAQSDITGLTTALSGKSNVGHAHSESDITGLTTALAGKAASAHTHSEADITGLSTDLAAKEPTITAGTTGQYWRGDKSWQTLDKTAVSLGNVDNTSDANKPVSTATTTALALKANLSGGAAFSGTLSASGARLTSPKIINAVFDADGNPLLAINKATGGVNYFTLANSATGTALTFAATGTDTNIGVNISSQGSAPVQLNSRNAVTRVAVPASATAAGVVDTVAWDSSYFYCCTATNTWVRTALATW